MRNYDDVLKIIAANPEMTIEFLNKELSMPNIPIPTMSGTAFWKDFAEFDGWKLQQNMLTQHARILRPDNVRVAWGTVNGMYKALDHLVESMSGTRYSERVTPEKSKDAAERLKQLKELLDIGAIMQEEFEKKKAEIIDLI